jgi:hypothetical protein
VWGLARFRSPVTEKKVLQRGSEGWSGVEEDRRRPRLEEGRAPRRRCIGAERGWRSQVVAAGGGGEGISGGRRWGRGNRRWRRWWLTGAEESKKEDELEVGPTCGVARRVLLPPPTGGIKEAPISSGDPIRCSTRPWDARRAPGD